MIQPGTVIQDLRYGVRMLIRNVAFTAVSVFALALGIGVNTATFTAYKAMIARPLDARDPKTMVNLALILRSGETEAFFNYPDYESYRDHLHSFGGGVIAQGVPQELTLSGTGVERSSEDGSLVGRLGLLAARSNAELASTLIVSENYFSVLGVRALRGRTFESISIPELTTSPAVLISENYWQKRFARDPALLGKTIRLNGAAFTIVGITPHDFVGTFVAAPDFWLPLSLEPLVHSGDNWQRDRENSCFRMFGRLAGGAGMGQAQAEMTLLANRLRELHAPQSELAKPVAAQVSPGSPLPHELYPSVKFAILLIMAAVGMVLVVACANVASLQLARATSRQSELCVRLSLGASRLRIIRQLLTESGLLGCIAGGAALLLSWALLRVGVTVAAEAFPAEYGTFIFHVAPDFEIFAYVFVVSLAASVLFGLAPALESSRAALASTLRTSTGTSPLRSRRLRDFLIATQIAISLAFMIAGSMLVRSAIRSLKTDTGYESKHVVDLDLQFPEGAKYTADRKRALVRELRNRLASLPGVAAITNARSPSADMRTAAVSLDGEKPSAQNTRAVFYYSYVQANYFETLGIPLLLGRDFSSQANETESSIIVSESVAQGLWPGQNPIGHSLRLGTDQQFHSKGEVLPNGLIYQIIGVVRDTRGAQLDGSDSNRLYVPLPEDRLADYPILMRTRSDPAHVIGALGPMVSAIDPDVVASASTLEEMLRQAPPFITSVLGAAVASSVGLLGFLLALMGIYGTVSYIVVLRTREVGIRMAIGAQKRDILGLMLRESGRAVVAGLVVGMLLALGVSQVLRGVLHGLTEVDGVLFVSVSLLFLAIALLAAYPPSRRAMRVDPMVALRYE